MKEIGGNQGNQDIGCAHECESIRANETPDIPNLSPIQALGQTYLPAHTQQNNILNWQYFQALIKKFITLIPQ